MNNTLYFTCVDLDAENQIVQREIPIKAVPAMLAAAFVKGGDEPIDQIDGGSYLISLFREGPGAPRGAKTFANVVSEDLPSMYEALGKIIERAQERKGARA